MQDYAKTVATQINLEGAVSGKIQKTLSFHDLPIAPPASLPGWKRAFKRDKKSRGNTIVFVGLKDIGEPELISLDIEKAIFWIEEGFFG